MVVCVLYPRFELVAALGGRRELLAAPAALAPEAGREQRVGESSAAAEAYGVVRGIQMGEALSRCPGLRLVAPDPQGVRELWGGVLDRLEAVGAAVESDRAGVAFFAAGGARGPYGGGRHGRVPPGAAGPGGSRASTEATSAACSPRRGGRWGAESAWARRPPASRPTPRRSRPGPGAPARSWSARTRRGASWRRCPLPCCAPAPSSRRSRRFSTSSGSGRLGSWRAFRRAPWPSASAIPACSPSTWPAAGTPRSSPAAPRSR